MRLCAYLYVYMYKYVEAFRGKRLSSITCLTQVSFKSGEYYSDVLRSLTA